MLKNTTVPNRVKNLELLSRIMDSQFSIPGTNFRFGLDPLIGLVPGAGDVVTFFISGFMVMILAQNGASGFLLARMMLNVMIDSLVGSIPFLGDLFDFGFKANQANLRLMREHYVEGRHRGSSWKLIIPVLVILLLFICSIAWLGYKVFNWVINMF
jgi:hypothetical protein